MIDRDDLIALVMMVALAVVIAVDVFCLQELSHDTPLQHAVLSMISEYPCAPVAIQCDCLDGKPASRHTLREPAHMNFKIADRTDGAPIIPDVPGDLRLCANPVPPSDEKVKL